MPIGDIRDVWKELDSDPYGLIRQLKCLPRWADYEFNTPDGREFDLFLDGRSIAHLMDADHLMLTPNERQRLREKIAGFIREIGNDSEVMVYGDEDLLKSAWLALHRSFGVPLTEDEREMLFMDEDIDDDAEDEE